MLSMTWFSERQNDIEEEAACIVIAAAKIIRAEIRECMFQSHTAANEDIANVDRQGMDPMPFTNIL